MTASCANGHVLDDENLRANTRGHRICMQCTREASRRSYEKRKSQPSRPCCRCEEAPRQPLGSYCRKCENQYQREWWDAGGRESGKAMRATERRRVTGQLATKLKCEYGLSVEEYDAMVLAQNNRCRICEKPPTGKFKRLCVDHNHETGEVRGLLCHLCNAALGLLRDDPDALRRALAYLAGGGV
jgi:hypothetical protein